MINEHRNNSRVLFVSHGGGPLPLLGDETHKEMVEVLELLAARLERPSAIIVVSAHWEEAVPTVTACANPPIIYDYYGFPKQAYTIEYPAPGAPDLARKVFSLLRDSGTDVEIDERRGFDHGLYVPLKIMYPEADIPCIQLSLLRSLDPKGHIGVGRALSMIDHEGLLIIGSGFSFHNMRAFFAQYSDETKSMNELFEQWLIDTCSNNELGEKERTARLVGWERAPHARFCHPREEHLLPLHVCYGIAQKACQEYFELQILGKKASFYLW